MPRIIKRERPRTGKRVRRKALTRRQQKLAVTYLPMARAMAKPMKMAYPSLIDEFESAACMAVVEAAQSYDKSRDVKFGTYARLRIWGALRDVQRSAVALGWRHDVDNAPQFIELTSTCEHEGQVLLVEPYRSAEEETLCFENMEYWFRKLPPRHAAAFREIYLNGKTQYEAAEILGCSQSRLSSIFRQAIAMLNQTMGNQNWPIQAQGGDGASA